RRGRGSKGAVVLRFSSAVPRDQWRSRPPSGGALVRDVACGRHGSRALRRRRSGGEGARRELFAPAPRAGGRRRDLAENDGLQGAEHRRWRNRRRRPTTKGHPLGAIRRVRSRSGGGLGLARGTVASDLEQRPEFRLAYLRSGYVRTPGRRVGDTLRQAFFGLA